MYSSTKLVYILVVRRGDHIGTAHLSKGRRETQSMRKVEALLVSRQPKKDGMGKRR